MSVYSIFRLEAHKMPVKVHDRVGGEAEAFLLYCRQKVCEIFTIFAPEMLTEYR